MSDDLLAFLSLCTAYLLVIGVAGCIVGGVLWVVRRWQDWQTDRFITKGLVYGDRRGWWDRYFR